MVSMAPHTLSKVENLHAAVRVLDTDEDTDVDICETSIQYTK